MELSMFYVAAAMAFIPAMVLMYALLRKYTYPHSEQVYFSDPSFFILFSVGLIAGTIMFMVYTYVMNSIIAVILYSIVQVLAVVVVMNLKRYRGKSDSMFYGLGFGIGAGCTTGTGFIYYIATATDNLGDNVDVGGYVFLFVMALGMLIQYAAVGTNVGEGIARHLPMQFAVQSMIANLVYWVVVTIALMNSESVVMYVMAVAALAIAVVYLYVEYFRQMTQMVREVDAQNRRGKKKKKDL